MSKYRQNLPTNKFWINIPIYNWRHKNMRRCSKSNNVELQNVLILIVCIMHKECVLIVFTGLVVKSVKQSASTLSEWYIANNCATHAIQVQL